MDTVEIIRVSIGIIFIVYGLAVSAYEKFHDMKYIDQVNGVMNRLFCIVAGVVISAYTMKIGVLVGIIALVLWIIEKLILSNIINKKNNKINNHESK